MEEIFIQILFSLSGKHTDEVQRRENNQKKKVAKKDFKIMK
jgi:hypothetical protein